MSVQTQTIHGLKFTLSEQMAEEIGGCEDTQLTGILKHLSDVIEAAELFPSFSFCVAFVVLLLNGTVFWKSILIASAILAGTFVLSFSSMLMMIPPVVAILKVYQAITKSFLHYIVMIAVGVIVKPWYSGLIAVATMTLVSSILMLFFGGYPQREPFNNAVAKRLIRKL